MKNGDISDGVSFFTFLACFAKYLCKTENRIL